MSAKSAVGRIRERSTRRASAWSSTVTDGDGLTYRVLLGAGGFSNAVCAKQVCILKTPPREKVNKPRLTYLSSTSHDRWKQFASIIPRFFLSSFSFSFFFAH